MRGRCTQDTVPFSFVGRTGLGEGAPKGLDALSERIAACCACPRLVSFRQEAARNRPRAFLADDYWSKPLPGHGDPRARLVVVGLAPAAHGGNRTGRMFTGDRSGDFLVAGLHRAGFANQAESSRADDGLRLVDAYVTAPVRCAPPDNKPSPEERDRCLPYLEEELGLLEHARVYLALGAYAYGALARLGSVIGDLGRPRPRFAHGGRVLVGSGRTVLCSYHPSQRNVFTGLLTAAMLDAVLETARGLL